MKKIIIESLKIRNFKGIQDLTLVFNEGETFLHGANRTGKTSVFDAFTWLMFGKDSAGRSQFEIKTLDWENNPIHRLEHEVEGRLMVDGRLIKLRKLYQENWVTKRGESIETMDGHETKCFWDDVPIQIGEYKRRVSDILDEGLFKLITDPFQFSRLGKDDRRGVLISMAGEVTDETLLSVKPELAKIIGLMEGKNIQEEEAKIGAKIKMIKEEQENLPARIDEASRTIHEEKDWENLEAQKESLTVIVNDLNEQKTNILKASEATIKKQREIANKMAELDSLYLEKKRELNMATEEENQVRETNIARSKRTILLVEDQIKGYQQDIENFKRQLEHLENENDQLRANWMAKSAEKFDIDDDELKCHACGRGYDADHVNHIMENQLENFNKRKAADLERMTLEGENRKNRIEETKEKWLAAEAGLERAYQDLKAEQKQLETWEAAKTKEPKIKELTDIDGYSAEKDVLEKEMQKVRSESTQPDTSEVDAKIRNLNFQLQEINQELGTKKLIEKSKERVTELKEQQKNLTQQRAELEAIQLMMTEYRKTKILEIENRVNGMFKMVKFRMFRTQINGGEEEVCDALYDGVPYDDLNSASRVNVGIDIINCLSRHHNTLAPIFIDNRESTTEIIETESQVVNLIVNAAARILELRDTAIIN